MCATSAAMQDVSAAANDWTGDGPASPALSIVIDALSIVAENFNSPIHVRSTTVGGLGATARL
jgi:hypothetical protein